MFQNSESGVDKIAGINRAVDGSMAEYNANSSLLLIHYSTDSNPTQIYTQPKAMKDKNTLKTNVLVSQLLTVIQNQTHIL